MTEKKFLKDLVCTNCGSDRLYFEDSLQPMGCFMQLIVYCDKCSTAVYTWNLSKGEQFPTVRPDVSKMLVKSKPPRQI